MIKSVGIDLAGTGEHKVRCLDERAQLCDGFGFQTTPDGLTKLEERVFSDGSNPVIVFEPTGLSWVAAFLDSERPLPIHGLLRPGHSSVLTLIPWRLLAQESVLNTFLAKAKPRGKRDKAECHRVYLSCQNAAALCESASSAGVVNDDFFAYLQEEIAREIRLMELAETESEAIAQHLERLYEELHISDNLHTIPGVGQHTAPIFLATVGNPSRFRSQSAFANYTGVVPAARQSSDTKAKGLRMTKTGPAIMKWALYQASQIERRCDPQLAWVYYRQMVYHGKNHKQAMGAVMSHMGARILTVLREDRPYELRDTDGKPISREEAWKLILSNYKVPEEIKRERRRKTTAAMLKPQIKNREMAAHRTNGAATAPQPVSLSAISNSKSNSALMRGQ